MKMNTDTQSWFPDPTEYEVRTDEVTGGITVEWGDEDGDNYLNICPEACEVLASMGGAGQAYVNAYVNAGDRTYLYIFEVGFFKVASMTVTKLFWYPKRTRATEFRWDMTYHFHDEVVDRIIDLARTISPAGE